MNNDPNCDYPSISIRIAAGCTYLNHPYTPLNLCQYLIIKSTVIPISEITSFKPIKEKEYYNNNNNNIQ